ncbi:hypothetical protein STSP2_02413 [Anaerohalosphaera lusitana]|uniref:Bacillithiol biosynthesis deacetylase BshB1 n=1 Tax=Anaerohalosphaera lusitana TaxID=1936003 RepID=A0A1U9NNA9_9BACT|nr:PIG-L family deacetylase [Anaerohalosphaera lusitana]AQT69224.1 hypothetical protein STSP2_02413 [Anaerohalosphaera lusitana]
MADKAEFVRLVGTERRVGPTLESVSRHWQGKEECALFVSPHDDDAVLGGGLLMRLLEEENVPVYIIITTDGRMGYCSKEEQDEIVEIRKKETFDCYQALGVPKENIIWLGFPDCNLNAHKGRKKAEGEGPTTIGGYTGLQNSFTYWLRKINPTQCFLPTDNDLHPDHRVVYEEFMISMFHAAGDIWPELGPALPKVPYVHEMAVYCDFPEPPTLRITTPESILEEKLAGIGKFVSQKQIASLIENVRKGGAQEYIRAVGFDLYVPSNYYHRFEHRERIVDVN